VKHHILISVGSNINKTQNTITGLQALDAKFSDLQTSTIYESESVGFAGDNFYNLVASGYTDKSVAQVCDILKTIEDETGRVRDKKFGNRTLDLDLLTYDNIICESPVILPRGEIEYNAFVLRPMAELVPEQIHPTTGKSYLSLWQNYSNTQQRLWPASLEWNPSN
jgi:2-amino-4-hydroxy-6-hydroxymethyldihydropteridine diphosphokinase